MAGLASYINRQAKHNLLFTSHEAEGISYVDVGRLLASEIESHLQDKRLCMKAEDALRKILGSSFGNNDEIGEYLAIKNIGILFEPALKLDVRYQLLISET